MRATRSLLRFSRQANRDFASTERKATRWSPEILNWPGTSTSFDPSRQRPPAKQPSIRPPALVNDFAASAGELVAGSRAVSGSDRFGNCAAFWAMTIATAPATNAAAEIAVKRAGQRRGVRQLVRRPSKAVG